MSNQVCENNIQGILAVLVTLIISEVLPFIKNIKSNGILELLYNIIYSNIYRLSGERQPLLHNFNNNNNNNYNINDNYHNNNNDIINIGGNRDNNDISSTLESKISELNTNLDINFQKISTTLVSYVNELQNTRQLKLHPAELYELNYFINYIKVNYPKKIYHTRFLSKTNKQLLISQGYIIDYDMQNDTHVIKW